MLPEFDNNVNALATHINTETFMNIDSSKSIQIQKMIHILVEYLDRVKSISLESFELFLLIH